MWLDERIDAIESTLQEVADKSGIPKSTLQTWINRGRTAHRLYEVEQLESLAIALQWDMNDMLRAIGYTHFAPGIDDLPDTNKSQWVRFAALPEWKQHLANQMVNAALKALEELPDDPTDSLGF